MGHENYFNLRAAGMDESSRLRYRGEIQNALAGIEVKRARAAELQAVIKAIGDASEAAAFEHSTICGPLQLELAALDEQHVQAIRTKRPFAGELTTRRVEILQRIADANSRLEMVVAANKKSEQKLRAEVEKIRLETAEEGPLQNAMQNLASADLQHQFAITADRLDWQRRRYTAARSQAEMNSNLIESERGHQHPDQRHIATYRTRLEGHQRVADDAAGQVRELDQQLAAIRQVMLAE